MNKKCSCCGQPFEPEVGYYYGSMFVSYAFSTAIFIAVWIALSFLVEEITILMMIGVLVVTVVLLLPNNFRLSRSIWIFFLSVTKALVSTPMNKQTLRYDRKKKNLTIGQAPHLGMYEIENLYC